MIYIAAPYSHDIAAVRLKRFYDTQAFVLKWMKAGIAAYSPVVYCHEIAIKQELPTDAAHWHRMNVDFLRRADQCFLLQLPGWEESVGVGIELKICSLLNLEVVNFDAEGKEI